MGDLLSASPPPLNLSAATATLLAAFLSFFVSRCYAPLVAVPAEAEAAGGGDDSKPPAAAAVASGDPAACRPGCMAAGAANS